ncbi:O-antigen ligase family protein [Maribellus luteus]|nr:O-antigen ligase family protein [Maribellus luteus]
MSVLNIQLSDSQKNYSFDFIFIALLTSVLSGIIGPLPVILYLIYKLGKSNNISAAIVLLLYANHSIGAFFKFVQFPIPGAIVTLLLGILFIRKEIYSLVRSNSYSIIYFIIVIVICLFAFLYGPVHSYSIAKLITITFKGSVSLIAFLLITSRNFSNRNVAEILAIICLLYLAMAFQYARFPHPTSVFDFSFFRQTAVLNMHDDNSISISYHHLGLTSMMGIAFLIYGNNKSVVTKTNIILFILFLYIILLSQARQAILGTTILIGAKMFLSSNKPTITKTLRLSLFFLFAIVLLQLIKTTEMQNSLTFNQGIEKAINRDFADAFSIIKQYPIFGKGLGGYSSTGLRNYPHNIILEILCEFGIIGFILLTFTVMSYVMLKKFSITYFTQNKSFYMLIIIAFFIRALISSDLTENIALFSALFAIQCNPLFKRIN